MKKKKAVLSSAAPVIPNLLPLVSPVYLPTVLFTTECEQFVSDKWGGQWICI